jgi:hypothetical protein
VARSTRLTRIALLGRERTDLLAYARLYVKMLDARITQGKAADDVVVHTAEDGLLSRLQSLRDQRQREYDICGVAARRIIALLERRADLMRDLAGREARDYRYVNEAAVFELLKVHGAYTPDNLARVTQRVIAWLQDQ